MSFYEELSKYYKYIFPLNNDTLKFLKENLHTENKILDIACGSGEYTLGLTKDNINTEGIDLDKEMIKKARDKAQRENLEANFKVANMTLLKESFHAESFHSAFCIGNSLVHLNSKDEINSFLCSLNYILSSKGRLVIQIVNYDRILKKHISSLPTITNKEAGVEFIRNYIPSGDKITFNTILKTQDSGEFENNIDLLPLQHKELMEMLNDNGFKVLGTYGSFKGSPFLPLESMAFIVTCEKL